jgi:hypothetical protein
VVIHLANGAAVKADEVWRRDDGVWYRQAGMITFLKRSRVKAIEPLVPLPHSQAASPKAAVSQSAATIRGEKKTTEYRR